MPKPSVQQLFRGLIDVMVAITILGLGTGLKLQIDMSTQLTKLGVVTDNTVLAIEQIRGNQAKENEQIVDIQLWKAETTGNRFTKDDGYKLAQMNIDRDASLTEALTKLANIVAQIPKENPQPWFSEKVDKIETTLTDKCQKLELRIVQLENLKYSL